jgi:hypothetical protein
VDKRKVLNTNRIWIFSKVFKKSSNIKFHKIRPVGAELFHPDRQTNGRNMTRHATTFLSTSDAICHSQLHIKESETGGTCSKHVKGEKRFQCRNRKPWFGETTWKAYVQIGG